HQSSWRFTMKGIIGRQGSLESWRRAALVVAALLVAGSAPAVAASKNAKGAISAYQAAVDGAYAKFKDLKEGKNADYIPALAEVDPNIFGIVLVTVDGKMYTAG